MGDAGDLHRVGGERLVVEGDEGDGEVDLAGVGDVGPRHVDQHLPVVAAAAAAARSPRPGSAPSATLCKRQSVRRVKQILSLLPSEELYPSSAVNISPA